MTDIAAEFKNIFYPESMAIVGASESLHSYGSRYIQALLDFGYKGRLYAVNHRGNEVLGFKIYRSVLDIPVGEGIQYAKVAGFGNACNINENATG